MPCKRTVVIPTGASPGVALRTKPLSFRLEGAKRTEWRNLCFKIRFLDSLRSLEMTLFFYVTRNDALFSVFRTDFF